MIEVIPAIDIINGECVRLKQGLYNEKTVYSANPLLMAKQFEEAGFTKLHLIDLDGAKQGKPVSLHVLENITTHTKLEVDYGGGIKTEEDMRSVLDAGADAVNIGSMAVKDPETVRNWIKKYGTSRFIICADVKGTNIAVNGWQQTSNTSINDFISGFSDFSGLRFLCTDISRDGMLEGPATALYEYLLQEFPGLPLIASGGVSSLDDLRELTKAGVPQVVVGKAFYEGRFTPKQVIELKT